jgi:hypothetical protein
MSIRIASGVLGLALTALGMAGACARGESDLDKKVVTIVKQVGALYKNAKSLQVDATLATTREQGDEKKEVKITATFAWERPNHFALRSQVEKDANAGLEIVCDGKMLYVLGRRLKQYTEVSAPAKMPEIGRVLPRYGHAATGMLFQNLLEEDPDVMLLDGVTACSHAGIEKVGDKAAHHLRFTQPDFTWEMWVAAEGQPFVLKAATTHLVENAKIVTVESYTDWKLDAALPAKAFAFTAPMDATKVKFLGSKPAKDK